MRKYSRQQQAAISLSYLETKNKQSTQLMASKTNVATKQAIHNPENDILKLPSLNSTRRSASTAERNTKFRLQNLDEKLQEFAAQVRNTRLNTQETIHHVRYLQENLANNEIQRIRDDLKKQVKGLQRLVHANIVKDEERFRIVRRDCSQLWNQTENLRSVLFQLKIRTDSLDERMGFKAN